MSEPILLEIKKVIQVCTHHSRKYLHFVRTECRACHAQPTEEAECFVRGAVLRARTSAQEDRGHATDLRNHSDRDGKIFLGVGLFRGARTIGRTLTVRFYRGADVAITQSTPQGEGSRKFWLRNCT